MTNADFNGELSRPLGISPPSKPETSTLLGKKFVVRCSMTSTLLTNVFKVRIVVPWKIQLLDTRLTQASPHGEGKWVRDVRTSALQHCDFQSWANTHSEGLAVPSHLRT
jgi:hypothetical protein